MSWPLYNQHYLKDVRKELRKRSTVAEQLLWAALRNRKLDGKKFRRQFSIGYYIADFYCADQKLVIELDGGYHSQEEQQVYDAERNEYLQQLGLRVLRFDNQRIENDFNSVLNEISAFCI